MLVATFSMRALIWAMAGEWPTIRCSAQSAAVESPGLECLDGIFRGAVGGDHDAALTALTGAEFPQQFQAQAVGQPHVGDEHIEGLFGQQLARL